MSDSASIAAQESVRGEPFDWLRTSLSNPAVSPVEPHERNKRNLTPFDQLRANG
ncbi:MAG: hypothetical protein P0120_06700 [Nitrospira sp.]|nr:hypothetical protein [Nitrospira sp.]